ncbi:MAG TPA: DegV family protein [Firmicutes bacterium]|nr:DegV family protein [Bacillota bacterium]
MGKIAIVTDSSAGLPRELIAAANLHIVPIGVQINHRPYREGVDLPADSFYAQLDSAHVSTSQPAPGDFLAVYKRLAQKAKEIISIHVTGLGSGTVNTANLVKEMIAVPISVVDSKTASMAQGFIALAAAHAAELGKTREEILAIIEQVKERTAIFVAVPTLKYLAKSGRIGSVQNLIASALSIKPILGVKDGLVDVVAKVRSYPRALRRLISLVERRFPHGRLNIAVLHTNALQEAEEFKEQISRRLDHINIFIAEMSASLAVHGGEGMLGIAVCDCPNGLVDSVFARF